MSEQEQQHTNLLRGTNDGKVKGRTVAQYKRARQTLVTISIVHAIQTTAQQLRSLSSIFLELAVGRSQRRERERRGEVTLSFLSLSSPLLRRSFVSFSSLSLLSLFSLSFPFLSLSSLFPPCSLPGENSLSSFIIISFHTLPSSAAHIPSSLPISLLHFIPTSFISSSPLPLQTSRQSFPSFFLVLYFSLGFLFLFLVSSSFFLFHHKVVVTTSKNSSYTSTQIFTLKIKHHLCMKKKDIIP